VSLAQAAALAFAALTGVVILFQIALALGAPLGAYAMGGRFPGRFPPQMRVAAVVQALLLAGLAGVVLARAGLALPSWRPSAGWLAWAVVGVSTLSLVMNLATPSRGERMIWAPVAALMLATSVVVAVAG
jgi:hypothetical protein